MPVGEVQRSAYEIFIKLSGLLSGRFVIVPHVGIAPRLSLSSL